MQKIFNPANYTFKWTEGGWYSWDYEAAHKAALQARNAEAKRLKAAGHSVRKGSLRNQLITKGGIGSGRPEISLVVNCYIVNT
jgi:hypothetical protein